MKWLVIGLLVGIPAALAVLIWWREREARRMDEFQRQQYARDEQSQVDKQNGRAR